MTFEILCFLFFYFDPLQNKWILDKDPCKAQVLFSCLILYVKKLFYHLINVLVLDVISFNYDVSLIGQVFFVLII